MGISEYLGFRTGAITRAVIGLTLVLLFVGAPFYAAGAVLAFHYSGSDWASSIGAGVGAFVGSWLFGAVLALLVEMADSLQVTRQYVQEATSSRDT